MFLHTKYRIYPDNQQKELISKHIGCCRLIYNLALDTKTRAYSSFGVNISCLNLSKQLPQLKKDFSWLSEVNSQSLQMAIRNLDNAYTNFFKYKRGFPKYKSKKNNKQSFHIPQNVQIIGDRLLIPKFKKGLRIKKHRDVPGEIKSASIHKTTTGKYFAIILCDVSSPQKKPIRATPSNTVGIDMGIRSFITLSNGKKISNPRFHKKRLTNLKRLQKQLSRKKRGSNNYNKAKLRVALLHETITNRRLDFLHKLSSDIVNNHSNICVEDLSINTMIKSSELSRSIYDAGWSTFINLLSYKCALRGKGLVKIGRFQASTKICSNCGQKNDVHLSMTQWECLSCHVTHDRDVNAAINIKKFGLIKELGRETPITPMELPTMVGAMK